jgi:hypothetical protein
VPTDFTDGLLIIQLFLMYYSIVEQFSRVS